MSFSFQDLAGPELRVRLPRVVDWTSPIWKSAVEGDVQTINTLFDTGKASPWDVTIIGGNLLHYAVDHWQPELCRLLLDAGVDPMGNDDFKM